MTVRAGFEKLHAFLTGASSEGAYFKTLSEKRSRIDNAVARGDTRAVGRARADLAAWQLQNLQVRG